MSVLALVLIILAGGFFLWEEIKNSGTVWKKSFVDAKGYEVKDTPEGQIIENKKEGFSAKIPTGWIVKKYGDEIDILSPEVEFGEHGEPSFESILKRSMWDRSSNRRV